MDYLAKVIDAANEGIYVTDPERRFLLWNEAAERITGYGKEEVLGRRCYDNILCHTDREGTGLCFGPCPLKTAMEKGATQGPEIVYLRHKTGRRIAVEVKTAPIRDDEGRVIGGVEIFQDVTERLERERLLRERTEKLEAVLNSIGDGLLFLDTHGSVAAVNRACAALFGLGPEATGVAVHELEESAPLARALSAVEQGYRKAPAFADAGAPCPAGAGRFRCWTAAIDRSPLAARSACHACATYRSARTFLEKPRELAWDERVFSVASSFIELPEANELWEVVVFHDVTAEKLDAALKVAGAAAHELRQPLQVAIMSSELLAKGQYEGAAKEQHLASLVECCERMDAIIRKMNGITSYHTKDYVGGINILDLERSSEGTPARDKDRGPRE